MRNLTTLMTVAAVSLAFGAASPLLALADEGGLVPPRFASLRADRETYAAGERAILTLSLDNLPSDPGLELAVTSQLGGVVFPLTALGDHQLMALTAPLGEGVVTWHVTVLMRDRAQARHLEEAEAYFDGEVTRLSALIAAETDAETRALLEAERDRDLALRTVVRGELEGLGRLLETRDLEITVGPAAAPAATKAETPALELVPDQAGYVVGETATITVNVLATFVGDDGVREPVVRATYDAAPVGAPPSGPSQFRSVIGPFTAGAVGTHSFVATLATRSKARADALRGAMAAAQGQRGAFIAQRDATADPLKRAYFSKRITRLEGFIDELAAYLEALLLPVGDKTLSIEVAAS